MNIEERLPYKKMIKVIDSLLSNDWGFDMIDEKVITSKNNKHYYKPFTHKESVEMVRVLGVIYQIVHCIHCSCKPNLEVNLKEILGEKL